MRSRKRLKSMTPDTKELWLCVLDFFAMYAFSLLGVMMSAYIPQLWTGSDIIFTFSWNRFAVSCVVSFMLMGEIELRGDQNRRAKQKPRALVRRAISAITVGSFWYNMLGAIK